MTKYGFCLILNSNIFSLSSDVIDVLIQSLNKFMEGGDKYIKFELKVNV